MAETRRMRDVGFCAADRAVASDPAQADLVYKTPMALFHVHPQLPASVVASCILPLFPVY
jgi:hypothetical protein